jgi:5-formyltetrahydrofolate cyclo-ligase
VFVRVDLDKIFAGTQPDIFLKPDDQLLVGTNAFAPFIAAARNAFRITYGAGFLYDRNFAAEQNNRFTTR